MLLEIFYWMLNMSIIGAAVSVIILLIRKIKRIPKSFVYFLWIVPLIRLLLPFGITSRYSLMNILSKYTTKTVIVYKEKFIPEFSYSNFIGFAKSYFPIEFKTNILEDVFQVASAIWLIIAAAGIIAAIMLYIFTKVEVKEATLYKENIYFSERITSPALYGFFKTKIIVPKDINISDLDYIILHEKAHAARHDNLWRCVAIIICCIHWFNPLCWISLKYFFEDMELSCDNKVLRKLTDDQTKEYAYAILNTVAQRSLFVAAFGGAKIKVRMKNILSYRRLTFISAIVLFTLIVSIIVVLITNPSV